MRSLTSTLAPLLAAALAAGCLQEQGSRYKTMAAAKLAGAVHEGWVPAWLPERANNLKENHAPDSKQSILRFDFPPEDKWSPPGRCVPVAPSAVAGPAVGAAWWPRDVPASGASTARHTYYACGEAQEFLAVDFGRGEGLYWRR